MDEEIVGSIEKLWVKRAQIDRFLSLIVSIKFLGGDVNKPGSYQGTPIKGNLEGSLRDPAETEMKVEIYVTIVR